ncbi:MAG: hypothetical protein HY295_03260 [Thaumarchaeota archaeon]|nr:hypothetical protein [Nitrososphaerota archaeon]
MFFIRKGTQIVSPSIEELQQLFSLPKPPPRKIDIIYENIPMTIIKRIERSTRKISGIYICSPWLTEFEPPKANSVLKKVSKNITFEVLTRKPEKVNHQRQVEFLRNECHAKIYTAPNLHAKMYLVDADPPSMFAMFGSPNFTKEATTNLEVAMISDDPEIFNQLYDIFQTFKRDECERF